MQYKLEHILSSIEFHPLLDPSIPKSKYVPIDLSVDNLDLDTVDITSSKLFENYIWNYIKSNKSRIAYGGYLEQRNIYNRSTYFNQDNSETNRNIHLGIDLWIEAGSKIYAPLEGEIHSFKNNTNYGDYGPTIILIHHIDNIRFYTLYGHLSLGSLKDKTTGDLMKKGDQLGALGTAEVNGDYPPHLHFQIIIDIEDYLGDYPGVSSKKDLEFYKKNCPNPIVLMKL